MAYDDYRYDDYSWDYNSMQPKWITSTAVPPGQIWHKTDAMNTHPHTFQSHIVEPEPPNNITWLHWEVEQMCINGQEF